MKRLVAFDLDGVLYTSEPFLADAYREAIALVNSRRPGSFDRVPTTVEILQHIGWPVPTILRRLFPEAAAAAIDLMMQATLDVICGRVARRDGSIYDGVPEVLRRLHDEGRILVVASNGRQRYVETVLRTYGLDDLVAPVASVDTLSEPTKAALLRGYLERYDVPARDAVMVGDRSSDVEAALAVGCDFVGCDYGHGHRDEIEGRGPIVANLRELPRVLDHEAPAASRRV